MPLNSSSRTKDARAIRRRHAEHYAAVAETADREPLATQPRSGWPRLDAEQHYLRAALMWSNANEEVDLELRIVGALRITGWFGVDCARAPNGSIRHWPTLRPARPRCEPKPLR